MMRKLFGRFFIFFLCLSLSAVAVEKSCLVDTSGLILNATTGSVTDSAKSFIRKMNQQQLNSLVDFLFEMDSIPVDLVTEINKAVQTNKCKQLTDAEFKMDWDENHIFSLKELTDKLDTTCVVNLINDEHSCFSLPIAGVITSNFGWRNTANHNGIDIDLNRGDKVVSTFDGIVRFAKFQGGFGNVVVVRHSNGLETLYAHLSKIKVKAGQVVTAGELLGLGGATGHARGTHLHFEVRFRSKPINPKYLIEFEEERLISEKLILRVLATVWPLTLLM